MTNVGCCVLTPADDGAEPASEGDSLTAGPSGICGWSRARVSLGLFSFTANKSFTLFSSPDSATGFTTRSDIGPARDESDPFVQYFINRATHILEPRLRHGTEVLVARTPRPQCPSKTRTTARTSTTPTTTSSAGTADRSSRTQ